MAWVKWKRLRKPNKDLVQEIEEKRTKSNPKFPDLVKAARKKRRAAAKP